MIKKDSASDAYKEAIRYVMNEGDDFIDKNGKRCREVLDMKIEITEKKENITTPIEMISKYERWEYPRIDEIANIVLRRKHSPGHIYVYGQRIFNFQESVNQIEDFVIPLLSRDNRSRRGVVNLWDPQIDSNIFNKEVPSIMTISFIVKGEKLNVSAVIRSNDIFFGLPANIYQIYLLQEYVSQRINISMGKITLYLLSAHAFEHHFDDIKEMI
ncbi:MAG: thymidylate synthase [Nanobdellota archaeon]